MKKILKQLWGNEFIQGGVFFSIASFTGNVLNYFFNLLAGRTLGPIGFGEITTLFSYSTIFSVPLLVMTMVIIEKFGSKGEHKLFFAKALDNWFSQRLKKWWFIFIIALLLSPFVSRLTNLSTITSYFLIPSIILTLITAFYGAIGQGLRLFLGFSLIGITAAFLKLLGPIFVMLSIDGLTTVIIFLLISSVVPIIAYRYIIGKELNRNGTTYQKYKIDKRLISFLSNKQVLITFFSILGITVLNNADIIFVKKFFTSYNAGIYSAWSLFAKIILYLIGPLISISYIFFTSSENKSIHEKALNVSLFILGVIAIGSYFLYSTFAPFIINIFFGPKFDSAISYLSQASIFGSLYAGLTLINNYFLAKKSKLALIIPFTIPFYLIGLFFVKKHIVNVMNLNIAFSIPVFMIYLIAYMRRFSYNNADGKQKG